MKINSKKIVTILVVVALVAAGGILVKRKKMKNAAAPVPTARPTPVRVEKARLGTLIDSRSYLGKVEAWRSSELAAQITARIKKIIPREGEPVKRGELLVELDDSEIKSSLAQAEATLRSLEKTVHYWEGENSRDQMLTKEGAIGQAVADATADHLNDAKGRFEAQIKRHDELAARLAYTRIRSPYDGVAARRLADPGDMASPGEHLLVVEDHERFKVAFDVPQEDLKKVKVGSEVRVKNDDSFITLKISRLYPSLNDNRTLRMEADAGPGHNLIVGTYHPTNVVLQKIDNAVLIPEVCLITSSDGRTSVFTIENGKTVARPVTVNMIRNGLVAVFGIKSGTMVVRSTYLGWNRLSAGETVEVLQ